MGRFLICVCLFACAAAFGQDSKQPVGVLPLEAFTRHDEFGTIKISPDGQFVALSTGKYGRTALVFIDLKEKKIVSGVRAAERFEIDDFYWVSSDRLIYLIAERQPGTSRPTLTGEIFAVDRDGRRHEQIYGYRAAEVSTSTKIKGRSSSYATPEIISVTKNDEKSILIAEYPWRGIGGYWRYNPDAKPIVTRLDVYSGAKRSLGLAPLAGATILVDRNDEVRFAFGENEQFNLAVSWKPQPGAEWSAFELPGFREQSIQPRRFSSDNHSVLFTGVREGEAFAALYRLDLKTKAVEAVHAFENGDVDGVVSDFADREIVGVVGYRDKPVYHWLNQADPAARLYSSLQRAFPGQSVRLTSVTDDGRLAIVFVSSDINPGDYYLFDVPAMKAEYLRSAREWIDPRRMRQKEPVAFAARDGLPLHGYLTRPAGDGPHPLVVLPHGGPHSVRDTWGFDWEVQLLASRGYTVLQVNFRGSGGYGMDFQAAGYREWGGKMQDDVTDATRWAIEQKIATPERICIFGASYGGYAALMGAVREPALYRCAIGFAGVYDLELMLSSADIPDSRSGRAYLDLALGNDVTFLRSRSPVHNAQQIQIPVLLVHGKEDWRVDYEQATRMKSALEQNRKEVEWMSLGREGHGIYDEETRREVYERVLNFLDRHLKGTGVAARQ